MGTSGGKRKAGQLLLPLILMAVSLSLLGATLWLGQAKKRWQQEDLQLARSLYVKWINPVFQGPENASVVLKVCNNSAAACDHFTIELQWSDGSGLKGSDRREFDQRIARGEEVALPPWLCPVKPADGVSWSAHVIPATKA